MSMLCRMMVGRGRGNVCVHLSDRLKQPCLASFFTRVFEVQRVGRDTQVGRDSTQIGANPHKQIDANMETNSTVCAFEGPAETALV